MPSHRFGPGQLVRLSSGSFPDRTNGSYKILRQLPETYGTFHYRIKSTQTQVERAVREDQITATT